MLTKKYLRILTVILCLPFMACSNVFQGMANKTSDEALFEDVNNLVDAQDWDTAIEKLEALSDDYKTRTDVREAWAGVYAGKCGLNFIEYFGTLGEADLSATTLFGYLMNAWTGQSVSASHCTLAQTKMEEISVDPADRTSGQNLFMAVLGMVKIGVVLRTYADRNGTDGLGDGTAEINVCTNDATNLPADAVTEVVTGLGLITTNLVYLTAVLSNDSITGAFDTVDTVCTAFPGTCGKVLAADVTDGDRDTFRDLLNTSSANTTAPLGVGACTDNLVVPCCP
ncbi:MAG: hypothetical protein ACXWC9_05335 [Pseudobdellovibrionaceae bacterium]